MEEIPDDDLLTMATSVDEMNTEQVQVGGGLCLTRSIHVTLKWLWWSLIKYTFESLSMSSCR